MTRKEKLARIYLMLRKEFDGPDFHENLRTLQVDYLIKEFKIIDLEEKIEAVKNAIEQKKRKLLNIFNECVKNNEAYYNKFKTKRGNILLISKYNMLPYFEVTYLNSDGKHVYKNFNHLSSYDTYNMINELIEDLNM